MAQKYSRNRNATLAGIVAVELQPSIRDRVVGNRESVDASPKSPSRPLSHMGMHLAGNNDADQVACVSGYHRAAPLVRLVTEIGKDEYNHQSQRSTHSSESVGGDALKAESP